MISFLIGLAEIFFITWGTLGFIVLFLFLFNRLKDETEIEKAKKRDRDGVLL